MIYDLLETDRIGTLVLAEDGEGLRHLNFIHGRHPVVIENGWRRNPVHFESLKEQLRAYLAGKRQTFQVTLNARGTPFQMNVWAALQEIPYGQVVSYEWIADRIGSPKAVRAVGAANGRNPISIIIPCHRVIGKNGRLTGYGGGLAAKRHLLKLENPNAVIRP